MLTLCLVVILAAAPTAPDTPIRLRVGGEYIRAVEGVERFTVKDPSIVDIRSLGAGKLWIQTPGDPRRDDRS